VAPPSNRDAVQIPIKYYLVAGKQDPVRIDIPKGTYVPTFHEQTGVESDSVRSSKSPDVGFEGRLSIEDFCLRNGYVSSIFCGRLLNPKIAGYLP
jgi:hypothetical protein